MSEKNSPINQNNNVPDIEFQNMLKEVFGQKDKIENDRRKQIESDRKTDYNKNHQSNRNQVENRTVNRNTMQRPKNANTVPGRPVQRQVRRPDGSRPLNSANGATHRQPSNRTSYSRPNQPNRSLNRAAIPANTVESSNLRKEQKKPDSFKDRIKKKLKEFNPLKDKNGKPLTGKQKTARIIVIIIAVILILALVVYGIYHFYYSLFGRYSGDRNNGKYMYNSSDYTDDADTMTPEEAEAALKKQLKKNATELMKDKDVMNILLIGEDLRDTESEERGNTDVMMMISLNKKNKTITMTSFMRDAWVYIDGYGQAKLNAAYWVDGPELLKKTIQDYYGVSIDRYVIVNFESFIKIVDALGGIEMYVSDEEAEGMKAPMAEQNNILGKKKGTDYLSEGGKLRLNGNQALAYARLRYVGNADYERTERQRRVITEIIKESKNLSLVEINKLLKEVLPEVKIDLTEGEVASLLLNCFEYMDYEIQELRIPADNTFTDQIINGLSVLCPDFNENTRIIIETIYGKEALDSYDEQNSQQSVNYDDYYNDYYYDGYNYNYGY